MFRTLFMMIVCFTFIGLLAGCQPLHQRQEVVTDTFREPGYALSDHDGGMPAYDPVRTIITNSPYRD